MSFDLSDIPGPVIDLAVDGIRAIASMLWERVAGSDDDEGAKERIAKAMLKATGEAAILEVQNRAAAARLEGDVEAVLVLVKAVEDALVAKGALKTFAEMGIEVEVIDPSDPEAMAAFNAEKAKEAT